MDLQYQEQPVTDISLDIVTIIFKNENYSNNYYTYNIINYSVME